MVGICTDICVMDFVLTFLSARNHDMMPSLKDILVYEGGCSTYHLPRETAEGLGLGSHAAHPQDVTHYMGLYFMASRGAELIDRVEIPPTERVQLAQDAARRQRVRLKSHKIKRIAAMAEAQGAGDSGRRSWSSGISACCSPAI